MHSATKPILVEISLNGTLFNFKPIPTHPDQILSVGNDHDVSVWSLTTGALVAKYKGTTNALVDATVHSDGKTFAYCSNDGILFVAYPDVRQINLKQALNLPTVVPLSVAFIDQYLAVGLTTGQIAFFTYQSETIELYQITEISNTQDNAWPTTLRQWKNQLIVFQKGILEVWQLDPSNKFNLHHSCSISKSQILSVDIQEGYLLTGDAEGEVNLFQTSDLQDLKLVTNYQRHTAVLQVQLLNFGDSLQIASGTLNPGISINGTDGKSTKFIQHRAAPFYIFDDGKQMIARSDTVTRLAYIEQI